MRMRGISGLTLVATLGLLLMGCEKEGPAERAGESIDQTMEEAKQGMQDAGDKMGEMMEEAGDQIEQATDEASR